jgi:hypothetical protein
MPLFLFLLVFSCRSKIQEVSKAPNKDTTLKILIWGLPDFYQQRAMEAVAKNYGFEYRSIAGCVISKSLEDSALKINERSFEILQGKFGNNWKIQIERKVHAFMDSISQADLNSDSSKVEVIGADGKSVDFSKDQISPPPTKENLKRESISIKKKGVIKIIKDCCTAEDSLEPKPPFEYK